MEDLLSHTFNDREVRVVLDESGEPWFVVADLMNALGYASARSSRSSLREAEKGSRKVRTPGGEQTLNVCNEPGLWRLLMRSNRPEAEKLQAVDLLERLHVLDDRDRATFGSLARNLATRDQPDADDEELVAISSRVVELGYGRATPGDCSQIGRLVAIAYRERYGEEPEARQQYVGGELRRVKCYRRRDLDLVDAAIRTRMERAAAA